MLDDHLRLMNVFAVSEEIIGRKKLQKMIYIAKKLDFPFQEKFEFHFYGPYSEELTLRVEELCNFGFIEESKEDKGSYYQYRYLITESGKEFLHSYQKDIPHLHECFTNMNKETSRFLELVSTILYFEEESKAEVVKKIDTLKKKQQYTIEEIDQAYVYIEDLKKTAIPH